MDAIANENGEYISTKKYWVATGMNFASVDVEFFDDPLAYGRAVREATRQHAAGDVDTYVHGDNLTERSDAGPVYASLYIAQMGDMGVDVEFFTSEDHYLKRLLALKEDEYYQKIDALDYNGPDVEFDPDAEDEDDLEDEATVAP
jgi:hypothetical protein